MNIDQIKAELIKKTGGNFGTLAMVRQFNQADATKQEPWLSHWDNDTRVRLTMHEDVFNQLKTDKTRADLALKYEVVPANATRAEYSRFVVIIPRNIEGTF